MKFSLNKLNSLPRSKKKFLLFSSDLTLVPLSLFIAFALRNGTLLPNIPVQTGVILWPTIAFLGYTVIFSTKLYQIKLHAVDHSAVLRIGGAAALLASSAAILSFALNLPNFSSVPIIFGAIFFLSSVILKVIALHLLLFSSNDSRLIRVAIYGAGPIGVQIAAALRQSTEARPCFFIDRDPHLQGLIMSGIPVLSPKCLSKKIRKHNIDRVLFTAPEPMQAQYAEVLQELSMLSVEVMILPSYVDLITKENLENSLRPVRPDELLGRDKVELDTPEIAKVYAGRTVLVTGAGGSIGSELCRQLLNCAPHRIILFEQSEYALYKIDQEIQSTIASSNISIEVVPCLGSVTNSAHIRRVMREFQVEIVIHAAAYKHVPMVEKNVVEGARNNVIGTQLVAEAAVAESVERFILVSTDKAVRPTSVMGGTKRMSEVVIQDIQARNPQVKFSIVRFGNVLWSSGSVLPLFESQIKAGGPVTVTHPEVTRFFMTIHEAARLVLLAGAFSSAGDLFVLDMGKPQKIIDIARKMIKLSGRVVREHLADTGDIELRIVGLRPGEKLHEELLIDTDNLITTPHSKILRAQEGGLSEIEVAAMLREISAAIESSNAERIRKTLSRFIQRETQIQESLPA